MTKFLPCLQSLVIADLGDILVSPAFEKRVEEEEKMLR